MHLRCCSRASSRVSCRGSAARAADRLPAGASTACAPPPGRRCRGTRCAVPRTPGTSEWTAWDGDPHRLRVSGQTQQGEHVPQPLAARDRAAPSSRSARAQQEQVRAAASTAGKSPRGAAPATRPHRARTSRTASARPSDQAVRRALGGRRAQHRGQPPPDDGGPAIVHHRVHQLARRRRGHRPQGALGLDRPRRRAPAGAGRAR